jgi:hypothetical protein
MIKRFITLIITLIKIKVNRFGVEIPLNSIFPGCESKTRFLVRERIWSLWTLCGIKR